MKDYSDVKAQRINDYTPTGKRSNEEWTTFHSDRNCLIDFRSRDKKRIVIAIDSFKGCLTSAEAGEAAAEGLRSVSPECDVVCMPVADGGEGILDVLMRTIGGQEILISAHGPLLEPQDTRYGISKDGQTAFIEMASISGLPLVPPEMRNPMLTTTYGTGELIRNALERGCRNFIIGIGGSATNDAGIGMLQALGFRFLDIGGNEVGIGNGEALLQIASIETDAVHPGLSSSRFTIACDVQNPFHGLDGAAYIFAPQKGADEKMVKMLDEGLRNFAGIIYRTTGQDIANYPGAGAAGGMGGSLLAFMNAELKPGIRLMLDTMEFGTKIKGADLIITGEGRADKQTLMGKVPTGILDEAKKQNIPVVLIAGSIGDEEELLRAGFKGVFSINPPLTPLEKAMQPEYARIRIRRTVEDIYKNL